MDAKALLIVPIALVAAYLLPALAHAAPAGDGNVLDLAGAWALRLDRQDEGVTGQWFTTALPDRVQLPGALPAQGIGDDVTVNTPWTGGIVDRSWFTAPEYAKYRQPGNVKVPFWLQPLKYYAGAAWYQRTIEVPEAWKEKRIALFLERPHWETRVWVDDKAFGTCNALGTPHEYDLGFVAPGTHRLTIRVDNRMVVDVGADSHSVSDHTQGNWNGIVGRIELRAHDPLWIADQRVFPKNNGTVRVVVNLRNELFDPVAGTVTVTIAEKATGKAVGTGEARFEFPRGTMPDGRHILTTHYAAEVTVKLDQPPKRWSEFSPDLYTAEARVETQRPACRDTALSTFGFREISTQGTQFVLNGAKLFIRGTLECCIFPKTGHPPTDVESWKRIIGIAKAHGLNNIRFHSWCPPEAAFVAADELGFYFHVECSSWANSTTGLGQSKPIDTWIYEEADRILAAYGNHPSFLLMPYGNEPGGNHVPFLKKWVEHYKAADPRRLYTSGAGWPQIPENQFHVDPGPRIQSWGGGLKSRLNGQPPETRTDYRAYIAKFSVPVISHEIGQWCVYPNFEEMPKYTGYLKPRNFEIFRDTLAAHHMEDQAKQFLLASGKLQTLCYKADIEAALRTPGMGGFQLLDLHDFPGQGTALVGVLDPFWDDKGYVTAAEFRRFCNSTVPLARLAKRVFTTDQKLEAEIEVAHFGPRPLENAVAAWKLVGADGTAVGSGRLPAKTLPVDNGIALGSIAIDLSSVPAPARYKLVIGIEGTPFENDWDVWAYPRTDLPALQTVAPPDSPPNVTVVDDLDDKALAALDAGGKVLLLVPPARVKNATPRVIMGFSSIFWNTAWTHRQPPTTLGILCDPKHPALAQFPTDYHSNWQWWYLVSRAAPLVLDDLPANLRPVVQVIDDWVTAHRLGLVIEAKVGSGSLVMCSIDLTRDLDQNPVARQMRRSLLAYAASPACKPAVELTVEQVRGLMTTAPATGAAVRAITADSFQPGYEPENAIDGNPDTMWHTRWDGNIPPFPHELRLELKQAMMVRGLRLVPRQDGIRNGWIKDYAVYLSDDGQTWGEPVAKGALANDAEPKVVAFVAPRSARFVRFVALSGHTAQTWASLAEVELVTATGGR